LNLTCQTWFSENKAPFATPASITFLSWRATWGEAYGNDVLEHAIECQLPANTTKLVRRGGKSGRSRRNVYPSGKQLDFQTPRMASVVEKECDYARNAFKLSPGKRRRQKDVEL